MEHSKGEMVPGRCGGYVLNDSGHNHFSIKVDVGCGCTSCRKLGRLTIQDTEEIAGRFRAFWNAFNGISTHDAMNIAQAAIHLHDNPGDLRYMKHGAEMESALRFRCISCENGLVKFEHSIEEVCTECGIKATLSKLEGGK